MSALYHLLYRLLGALALPVLFVRLLLRSRKNPLYRYRIGERFGCDKRPAPRPLLMIHAVSVGETRAAAPLIAALKQREPETSILLTHMTATGRATGADLFRRYGAGVLQAWLPYDYRFAVRRFLRHWQPRSVLLMETEVWPTLVDECARQGIPCFLINARMSERSRRGYARHAAFTRPTFAGFTGIAAQTDADAQRLTELGAHPVIVTGNLKFDIQVPDEQRQLGDELRQRFNANGARRIWVAASTRDGEETLILNALDRTDWPADILTVLVPRHPERFAEVAKLLTERGTAFVRRSDNTPVNADTRVVLGDSMGELFAYYVAADCAFVGGSLKNLGGQNLLEPIAVGTPPLIGQHTFNFKDISEAACECGAARRIDNADALIQQVRELLNHPEERAAMRDAGAAFLTQHQGATARLMAWLF